MFFVNLSFRFSPFCFAFFEHSITPVGLQLACGVGLRWSEVLILEHSSSTPSTPDAAKNPKNQGKRALTGIRGCIYRGVFFTRRKHMIFAPKKYPPYKDKGGNGCGTEISGSYGGYRYPCRACASPGLGWGF